MRTIAMRAVMASSLAVASLVVSGGPVHCSPPAQTSVAGPITDRFATSSGSALALPSPMSATAFPGDNGRIAFTDRIDRGGDITKEAEVWSMRADGTGRRLHFSAVDEDNQHGAWSPDGRWLAFTRSGRLMVARPDGSEARLMDDGTGPESSPDGNAASRVSWSPDGTRLVYEKARQIWVINADGSDRHIIVDNLAYAGAPLWSPTGDLIAFRAYDGDMEVFVTTPDGGGHTQLTYDYDPSSLPDISDSPAAWAPDGSKLLYVSNRDANPGATDLWVMDPNGANRTRLYYPGHEYFGVWSPDGTTIGFASEPAAPHSELPWFVTRNVATGATKRVVQTSSTSEFDWGPEPGSMSLADLRVGVHSELGTYQSETSATYVATVTNAGPDSAADVRLDVQLPPGSNVNFTDATCDAYGRVRCYLGELAPGNSTSVTIQATTATPGLSEVTAMVTSDTPDPVIFNNRGSSAVAICTQLGTASAETIVGTEGNDVLCAGDGSDTLQGLGGDDIMLPAGGEDGVDGGTGADTVSYAFAAKGVAVDLATRSALGEGADTLKSIENVHGSRFADTLRGSAGANDLSGGPGSDLLTGGWGDDDLSGGTGPDTLVPGLGRDGVIGGPGIDLIDYSKAPAVTVNLAQGGAFGAGTDWLRSIENVLGSRYPDIVRGSLVGNRLLGGPGADRLVSIGGNDTSSGGRGADRLIGGDGNDNLAGGLGTDTCIQSAGSGTRHSCEG